MVLEPTIGPFHFALGLRREGIGDFHIAILQNLLPLRDSFICEKMMFSPERVPPLNKSEDGMGVYIVAVRESVSKDDGLKGQDMSPSGFLFEQSGIKDQPVIIIQVSNQVPLFLGCRCPEMIGGV
jgi:hypothetical protein